MKKVFFIVLSALLLGIGFPGNAQAQGPQYIYRIRFADKAGSPPLSNPSVFLSQRALNRRARLGIAVADDDRPVSPFYTDTVLQLSSGRLHTTSRWRNEITLLLPDSSSLPAIRTKSWVLAIEDVGFYAGGLHLKTASAGKQAANSPSTIPALKAAGSAAYYGAAWNQNHLVNGDALHDAGYTGTGMLIAIIDEQFRGTENHPGFAALRTSGRLVDSFNFILRNKTDLYYGSSHGTSVLSAIAGFQPNIYVGAAPESSIAFYITEDPSNEQRSELDQLISGMERADSIGADIISASLGYNTFNYPAGSDFTFAQLDGKTTSVAQAANLATAKGMLVVVAAGNEGSGSWQRILTPGDADSVLTVGSVASNGVPAPNSGYGPNAAGRIKPDVCGLGQGAAVYNASGSYFNGSGTSFSTPQIAGFAACLWQAFPTKKPGEIREAIVQSAHRYHTPEVQLGYGIPNFAQAFQALGIPQNPLPPAPETRAAFYNAAEGRISLSGSFPGPVQLSLYDLMGRKISGNQVRFSGNKNLEWTLNTPLPTGMYLLHYQTPGDQGIIKLIAP